MPEVTGFCMWIVSLHFFCVTIESSCRSLAACSIARLWSAIAPRPCCITEAAVKTASHQALTAFLLTEKALSN